MFFNHFPELIIVLVIALVVFGPKRLPELGSSLGKGIREFRKATSELQDSVKVDTAANLPPEQQTFTSNNYTTPQHTNVEYTATTQTTQAPLHEHEAPRV